MRVAAFAIGLGAAMIALKDSSSVVAARTGFCIVSPKLLSNSYITVYHVLAGQLQPRNENLRSPEVKSHLLTNNASNFTEL